MSSNAAVRRRALCEYLDASEYLSVSGLDIDVALDTHQRVQPIRERDLLREAGWVVLSVGLSFYAVRSSFTAVTAAFRWWQSAADVCANVDSCIDAGVAAFRHSAKIRAIAAFCEHVHQNGAESVVLDIRATRGQSLVGLPYFGPASSMHLAKNLGASIAKPDRHLLRIAARLGFASCQELCSIIAGEVGTDEGQVDFVFWRASSAGWRGAA